VSNLSTFILTLPLKTNLYQEDILHKRLDISRQIYNACLGELFKRYRAMQQSKAYHKVIAMPKGKDRNKLFRDLNKQYGLTNYALHTYVKPIQHHFKDNIDSFTAQTISTRCFRSFQKLMLRTSRKVYFKRFGELNSVEGKSNGTGIRFVDGHLVWNKLSIPAVLKPKDMYAHISLDNNIKYCRIIRKLIRGKCKFYIQLVLAGVPPAKHHVKVSNGLVGLDIGTQTLAICSQDKVKLLELAPETNNIEAQRRLLHRKLDRQRRANNPNNYNNDGTIKTGVKLNFNKSNRYLKTQNKLKEIQRKQAAIRKQSHEKLANYILSIGDTVKVESMNYKGIQYNFGKSLANKAPAMFLTILDNKLKWQGKELIKINTSTVKASQYNHFDDTYTKKPLSQRWNDFGDIKIQRDLYSAFLIMNIKDNLKEIDQDKCTKEFKQFKKLHDLEIKRIKNSKCKSIGSMGI